MRTGRPEFPRQRHAGFRPNERFTRPLFLRTTFSLPEARFRSIFRALHRSACSSTVSGEWWRLNGYGPLGQRPLNPLTRRFLPERFDWPSSDTLTPVSPLPPPSAETLIFRDTRAPTHFDALRMINVLRVNTCPPSGAFYSPHIWTLRSALDAFLSLDRPAFGPRPTAQVSVHSALYLAAVS